MINKWKVQVVLLVLVVVVGGGGGVVELAVRSGVAGAGSGGGAVGKFGSGFGKGGDGKEGKGKVEETWLEGYITKGTEMNKRIGKKRKRN